MEELLTQNNDRHESLWWQGQHLVPKCLYWCAALWHQVWLLWASVYIWKKKKEFIFISKGVWSMGDCSENCSSVCMWWWWCGNLPLIWITLWSLISVEKGLSLNHLLQRQCHLGFCDTCYFWTCVFEMGLFSSFNFQLERQNFDLCSNMFDINFLNPNI